MRDLGLYERKLKGLKKELNHIVNCFHVGFVPIFRLHFRCTIKNFFIRVWLSKYIGSQHVKVIATNYNLRMLLYGVCFDGLVLTSIAATSFHFVSVKLEEIQRKLLTTNQDETVIQF